MPTVNTLVANFIAAGDTTRRRPCGSPAKRGAAVLAAGQALHAHVSDEEWIPVSSSPLAELEYFRTVQRFARFGGDRDVAHALLSWAETEYAEHELE